MPLRVASAPIGPITNADGSMSAPFRMWLIGNFLTVDPTILVVGDLSVNTLDLGNNTDTTLSRLSGGVVGVEGTALLKNGGALGTPLSGTLSSCTGLPIGSGVSGLGTGVATFLGTPSSANLAAAVTGETGSGALVFATSPAFTTPALGTPTAGVLSSCTGYPTSALTGLGANVAAFLATPTSANFAAAVTGETGTGAVVFGTQPTLSAPTIASGLFAALPGSPVLGMLAVVTDSTTAAWGATIAGTGALTVLGFFNGANWTVAGA